MALGRRGGAILVDDGSLALLVDGAVVGACLVQLFDGTPEVSWLCTVRSMRRRGATKVLLSSSLRALEQASLSQVVLFVNRGNHPARRLYERFGFVESVQPSHVASELVNP